MIPWLPIAIINWQKYLLILGMVLLSLGMAYMKGCTDEREKSAAFKAKLEAQAEAQKERNERERVTRNAITEAREAEHATLAANLKRDLERMRERSSTSVLPRIAEGSKRPDLICFDRRELDNALTAYRREVTELVGEGAEATLGLNVSRRWWQEQARILR